MLTHGKLAVQVTTGDPVSADPWALAASRRGYDCGAALRTGCTVTTAYATAPANASVCCDPHAAPGSPVLVFSPFAARRNAPYHPHSNAFVSSNNAAIQAASAAAAAFYPADCDSLTSDRSAFDDCRGEAMTVNTELQVWLAGQMCCVAFCDSAGDFVSASHNHARFVGFHP